MSPLPKSLRNLRLMLVRKKGDSRRSRPGTCRGYLARLDVDELVPQQVGGTLVFFVLGRLLTMSFHLKKNPDQKTNKSMLDQKAQNFTVWLSLSSFHHLSRGQYFPTRSKKKGVREHPTQPLHARPCEDLSDGGVPRVLLPDLVAHVACIEGGKDIQ